MKKKLLFITLIGMFYVLKAQVVLQPITSSVYDFLDEMANDKHIELNSAVKPYSRMFIASKLQELYIIKDSLNKRQQKELAFYLKDFNKEWNADKNFDKRKDLFYYAKDGFKFTINPILGYQMSMNDSGKYTHRWNGAELYGYVGKHFGFQASLRDNGVSDMLALDTYLTPLQGANYKLNQGQSGGRSDYSEAKGAVYYSWEWGRLGIVKESFTWGDNYHGANILSAKPPSFAYIDFYMKPVDWFELNFTHSWLVSELIDSARTYLTPNGTRRIFMNKNLAANLFTFKPFKNFFFSFGNSIVYADDGIKPYYLLPVMFYKSIDHTYNSAGSDELGQNSQMFFNISSRQIKHTHLYFSLFFDELSISRAFDKDNHTNLYSGKIGIKINNLLIKNTYLVFEYTRTNPWTYRHQIPSTTFQSNNFVLGHYLSENAQEIYIEGGLKLVRGLKASLSYTQALKGPEHVFQIINGETNTRGLKFLEQVVWQNNSISGKLSYEIINDGYIFAEALMSNIEGEPIYHPAYFNGKLVTISGGVNFGF